MRRALTILLVALLAVGLSAGPASAQTKVRQDRVGEVAPTIDVRSLKVQNTSRSYALTARFVRVRRGHTALAAFIDPRRGTAGYLLQVLPTSRTGFAVILDRLDLAEDEAAGLVRVSCPGATARARAGRGGYVRVVVPQTCLGAEAGTLSTSAFSLDGADGGLLSGKRGDEEYQDDADAVSEVTTRRG